MTELTYTVPAVGEKVTVAEPLVDTALSELKTVVNSKIGTANLENKGVTKEKLATAITNALLLTRTSQAASFEIAAGEFAECTKTLTVTLPAPTSGVVVGVYNAPAVSTEETTVKQHAAELIAGDFVNGVTSVKLAQNQHLVLIADGTNWLIISGESKREQKYEAKKTVTKAETEAAGGIEVSATRPSRIAVAVQQTAGTSTELLVEGKWAGQVEAFTTEITFTLTADVMPGQKWKLVTGATTIKWSFILL